MRSVEGKAISRIRHHGPAVGGLPAMRFVSISIALAIFTILFSVTSPAQDDPVEAAPPPIKFLSKEERAKLDTKQSNIKDRTKLSLELMDLRMDAAEKFAQADDYDSMFRELGGFHALMDDGLEFLARRDGDSGKVLDNFKRFEIGLRAFSPRIEVMRRELPLRYDYYVRKLMGYVREARAKAIDPLFGDSVVTRKPGN